MQLPFTVEQFFSLFHQYNEAIWPAQILLICLALLAIFPVVRPARWGGVVISAILGFLWFWSGLAYHLLFFTQINSLAYLFSAVSLIGGVIFLWHGVVKRSLQFKWVAGARGFTGAALVIFSLVVYPLWSWYSGHSYPAIPTFGLPCPTTIFTIGMLAFLVPPYPRSLFIVPVLWCMVGAQAAFLLNVPQDMGLIVAAVVGLILLARSNVLLEK
jgi:hypothetical protein